MLKGTHVYFMAIVVLMLVTVGCGGSEATPTPTPTAAPASPTPTQVPQQSSGDSTGTGEVVNVTHGENPYKFMPDSFDFELGKTYLLKFTPPGEFHTFTVKDMAIDMFINAGETTQLEVTPSQVGTFKLICVPHETSGMVGEIRVT
ncbi:plastocyanin/azurin family copper-binding protein [Dehalococcoidia bacterium]|nr:plastocyanin/azurin family copper-binding protein [Dehalococcoidia bacterium]